MPSIQQLGHDRASGAPVALVLPGAGYTVQAPLLYWPVLSLLQADWDVWSIYWHADITESVQRDIPGFINAALAQADRSLPAAPKAVIGKSLGSFALPHFVDRDVCAVWLTPILTDPGIVDAARSASGDHLLVGGTADPSWQPDTIRDTGAKVISVPSADHGLESSGSDWRASAIAQIDLLTEVVSHLQAR